MKRDMELVRDILLHVQARNDAGQKPIDLPDHDPALVERHVEMMIDAGLLKGLRKPGGLSFSGQLVVYDMSWEGHDFLAAMQNKGVWSKIKQSFSAAELAGLPIDVLKDVGIGLLKEYAKGKVGLSGD